jgi:hypothetical protein
MEQTTPFGVACASNGCFSARCMAHKTTHSLRCLGATSRNISTRSIQAHYISIFLVRSVWFEGIFQRGSMARRDTSQQDDTTPHTFQLLGLARVVLVICHAGLCNFLHSPFSSITLLTLGDEAQGSELLSCILARAN